MRARLLLLRARRGAAAGARVRVAWSLHRVADLRAGALRIGANKPNDLATCVSGEALRKVLFLVLEASC